MTFYSSIKQREAERTKRMIEAAGKRFAESGGEPLKMTLDSPNNVYEGGVYVIHDVMFGRELPIETVADLKPYMTALCLQAVLAKLFKSLSIGFVVIWLVLYFFALPIFAALFSVIGLAGYYLYRKVESLALENGTIELIEVKIMNHLGETLSDDTRVRLVNSPVVKEVSEITE